MLAEEGDPYFEGLKQVKYFYEDAFRVINYGLAPVTMGNLLNTGQDTYMQSIDEIGLDIVKMLRNTDMSPEEEDVGKFLPRIVIFGRKGSGRKTQAKALANHFNLVFGKLNFTVNPRPIRLCSYSRVQWSVYTKKA